jgi:hypothetical protein
MAKEKKQKKHKFTAKEIEHAKGLGSFFNQWMHGRLDETLGKPKKPKNTSS